ncbi:chemotaxis protein CheW [Hydrogenophaga intermedia]|jgi:twitching motility protein PilI|uniref:chemotaxis protein CheW n=1 Tax=Hydrogenophaga intermedia TaxID=65786 RepID=UPI0020443DE8|nr:chemotaxis protein CheW [Hydrogenophaga intermedia]MCM3562497.1 chemotaxis protein CheW [Hydrogenophaga intermedia]
MAKRQSLKELQERLAQRLTAAKTEALTATWLAIEAGGHKLLLPLVQSGEIFPWSAVQPVPYTKPWYVGVANLRGGLNGVVDLAGLLQGNAARPVQRTADRVTSDARLVSLHGALGLNAVLWIDRLLGLRNPGAFKSVAQRPADAPTFITRLLIDDSGQAWQELDLQLLVNEPEFLAIAA